MEYQGRLYFMPGKRSKKNRRIAGFLRTDTVRRRTVRKLSGGMKRKLMVCVPLNGNRRFFFWMSDCRDGCAGEKTNWNLLRKLNEQGNHDSSHDTLYGRSTTLCNRVAMLHEGKRKMSNTRRVDQTAWFLCSDQNDRGSVKSGFFTAYGSIEYLPTGCSTALRIHAGDVFVNELELSEKIKEAWEIMMVF